jgi:hypothetical protein
MQPAVIEDPRDIYTALHQERQASILAAEGRQRRLGYWRLGVVAAAGVLVWLALSGPRITILWTLIPIAAFVALMATHARLARQLEKQRRAARFFERGLARLEGNWPGTGSTGDRFLDLAHPYAQDLDLFGIGSLFELLSTARTSAGERTLARWLLEPADLPVARSRQEAVTELRPRLDLRERLAVLAEDARTGVDADSLARWGEAEPQLSGRGLRFALWACTVLGIAGAAAGVALLLHLTGTVVLADFTLLLLRDLLLSALAINGWFYYRQHRRMTEVVTAVDQAAHELGLISEVLVLIEREQFHAPLLVSLGSSLAAEGAPPSRRLAQLKRLIEYLDSRDNVFVRVAEIFILWTPHMARARGTVAPPLGPGGAAMAGGGGRNRGARLAGQPRLRASPGSVPRVHRRIAAARSRRDRPSADPGIEAGAQFGLARRQPPPAGGERFQYVRQKHAAAHAGCERGAGAGRSAGARRAAAAFAAGGGRVDSCQRFAAGRHLALLRRNSAPAADPGPDRRPAPGAVSDRRIPARHQFPRPADRRRGTGARPGGARRGGSGHHPRPGAGRDRRCIGERACQRPLRRPHRGWQGSFRLP